MLLKKIRKGHVDWRDFLCSTPANDYIFQKNSQEEQIKNAVKLLKEAKEEDREIYSRLLD